VIFVYATGKQQRKKYTIELKTRNSSRKNSAISGTSTWQNVTAMRSNSYQNRDGIGYPSPHFLFSSPFYDYAYAFGQLFVLALYQKYLKEGKEFVPKYKYLLSAGGSKSPIEATREIGNDITMRKFWQNSLITSKK